MDATGGVYKYVFQYKDHLGNIRVSYTQEQSGALKILEENNYYPFGMKHAGYNSSVFDYKQVGGSTVIDITTRNKSQYKYNGQEFQDEAGLNMTAMDYRQYDNALGRFHGVDVLAELDYSGSPYSFGFNNPVYFSDPSGLTPISELPQYLQAMWYATADGTNSYWYNNGTGMTSDNLGGGSGGNVDFATGQFTAFDSLVEVTIKTNSRGDSSFIGQLTSHVYSNGKYYQQFRADNLTRATNDVQEYFGMLGVIDPIGIIDGLNAVGYGLRGQKANAIASGLAILPFGDLAKLVKIQKHHIIPQAVFRDAGEAIQNAMELNGGFNLKKLPTPFHGNHPQYNTFVRNQLNAINKVNVTPGSIQTLQKDLNGMINNAYDNYKATGQNLNDYFRQFNGN